MLAELGHCRAICTKRRFAFPKQAQRIESYVNRLEDQSTFFLYVYTRLRRHIAEKGPSTLDFNIGSWWLEVCYRLLKPFHSLYQAICLYTGSFKDGKPVIEAVPLWGGGQFMIDPFTETGHKTFEDALDQIEEWASEAIFWIRKIAGPPLDLDVELYGQV